MDKETKIKVINRLRSKRNELETKIHKKILEVDKISHKKARGNYTPKQLNIMHNQIMKAYDYIKKWTIIRDNIDKKISYVLRSG